MPFFSASIFSAVINKLNRKINMTPSQESTSNGFVELSEEQECRIIDAGGGYARSLAELADLKSFVYDRKFGVFPVDGGHHQQVMSQLCAFHHGFESAYDMLEHLQKETGKRKETSHLADLFIEKIPGTAFKSSVGKCVTTGTRHSLSQIEKRIFGELRYAFDN